MKRIPLTITLIVVLGAVSMLICRAPALPAAARLVDGRLLHGEAKFETGTAVTLLHTNGSATRISFHDLRSLRFGVAASASTPEPSATDWQPLPAPWRSQDIGAVEALGSSRCNDQQIVLRGAGTNVWHQGKDQLHFAFQKVSGDGSIRAKLERLEGRCAGLMIRKDLSSEAEFVMASVQADGGLSYCARRSREYRDKFDKEGDAYRRDDVRAPCWLRLDRVGKKFSLYRSLDNGAHWEFVARSRGRHVEDVYFGLFVMSGDPGRAKEAVFNHVTIEAEKPNQQAAKQREQDAERGRRTGGELELAGPQQLLLRSGTSLPGRIQQIDGSSVTIEWLGRTWRVPAMHVARIYYRPLPLQALALLSAGRSGALLTSGDFCEGDFVSLQRNQLVLSSVLFGRRSFDVPSRVVALIWHDVQPAPEAFEIKGKDGALLRVNSLSAGEDELLVQDAVLGQVNLRAEHLREIVRSESSGEAP